MKCEIIRDLLPSYIDNLTSDESNVEVEKHLKNCSECRERFENMNVDINDDIIKCNKDKIKPLKKLNQRVMKAVVITIAICSLLIGSYIYLFAFGWKVNSNDLAVTYSYDSETILINLELNNSRVLNARTTYNSDNHTVLVTECFNSILDSRGENPNKFAYGIHYKDENGNIKKFTDKDVIKLELKDKTQLLNLKEIAEELGLQ